MVIDFHTHIFPEKIAPRAVSKLASVSFFQPHTTASDPYTPDNEIKVKKPTEEISSGFRL
ncbi:MAG: hypothetical protein J6D13_05415 [Clostridium sp.]|nr:hypothetical protein [Clostridium sp.]